MATHRSGRLFLSPLAAIADAVCLAGCGGDEADPAPASTTVAVVGQPTEVPTVDIDPAPVVTEGG